MGEIKGKQEINKFINKKKKQKRMKKKAMISTIIIIAAVLFFTKAPIFQIKKIFIEGTSQIDGEGLKESVKSFVGENIYTVNEDEIKKIIMENKYVREVNIKRKGNSKLIISVSEEAPVFYVRSGNTYKIITEDFEIVEDAIDITGKNYVEIIGVDGLNAKVGDIISSESTYRNILKKFYPYISQNKENIKIDSIDISDIVDIKLKIKDVEVYFGDDSEIYNKINNIYSIMLSENINLTSGYINVSYDGPPVIKRNSN